MTAAVVDSAPSRLRLSIDGGSTEGEDSIDGGSQEGEDRVSKRDFYRIERGAPRRSLVTV